MALKKSEKRLLLILSVVVAVFLVNQIISGGKKKAAQQQTVTAAKGGNTVPAMKGGTEAAGGTVQKTAVKGKVSYDSWGRDPFYSPNPAVKQAAATIESSLKLNGIIRKGQKVYALINDTIIGPGEEKDGIRVEKIEGKTVVCVKNGVRVTLEWKG